MMRVMDFAGWVPQSGGAYRGGDKFPISAEEVTIEKVLRVTEDHVAFTCDFGGKSVGYDFYVPDIRTAEKVAAILSANVGGTLFSIGILELPPDA
jgi:hypothetical protein